MSESFPTRQKKTEDKKHRRNKQMNNEYTFNNQALLQNKLFVKTFDKDLPPSEHVKLIKVQGGLSAYFCITCTSAS